MTCLGNPHITRITNNANKSLGFLRRNLSLKALNLVRYSAGKIKKNLVKTVLKFVQICVCVIYFYNLINIFE